MDLTRSGCILHENSEATLLGRQQWRSEVMFEVNNVGSKIRGPIKIDDIKINAENYSKFFGKTVFFLVVQVITNKLRLKTIFRQECASSFYAKITVTHPTKISLKVTK